MRKNLLQSTSCLNDRLTAHGTGAVDNNIYISLHILHFTAEIRSHGYSSHIFITVPADTGIRNRFIFRTDFQNKITVSQGVYSKTYLSVLFSTFHLMCRTGDSVTYKISGNGNNTFQGIAGRC